VKGLFITFEGPDGAGKTTQLKKLAAYLESRGHDLVVTREPGGTPISDRIRTIILSPENKEMTDQAEVLLYAASRAQHVHEKILPALDAGKTVLCDRFIDASVAYQAHGLGMDETAVRRINAFASSGLQPARTYLLDIPVEESHRRLAARAGVTLDRIERRSFDYHQSVRNAFHRIAEQESGRVRIVAADRSEEAVFEDILEDFLEFWQEQRKS
jgi:dTMP kinase